MFAPLTYVQVDAARRRKPMGVGRSLIVGER
ncbi:hypothetical protein ACUY4Q_002323 [Phytobacter sp. AG2a]